MQKTFFEATAQQKQLADMGRAMMDWSEDYGKVNGLARVTDNGLRTLNDMSRVGYKLTQVGGPWGTTVNDFSEEDRKLIVAFMQKAVDIERK